jgi:hypothetical protein
VSLVVDVHMVVTLIVTAEPQAVAIFHALRSIAVMIINVMESIST